MKVWVVVVDNGLNGPDIAGVFGHEPSNAEIEALEISTSTTGFQGWDVEEHEVQDRLYDPYHPERGGRVIREMFPRGDRWLTS